MFNVLLSFQCIGIAILIIEIIFILFQNSSRIQRDMIFLLISLLIVFVSYTMEMLSKGQDEALLAAKFGYLGKPFLILSMFYLITDYCRIKPKKSVSLALLFLPVFFSAAVFTNKKHKLFYTSVGFSDEGLFPHLLLKRGIIYAMFMLYLLVVCCVMIFICFKHIKETNSRQEKRQLALFVAMISMPLLMLGVFMTNVLQGYDCTLCGYLFSTIGFSISFWRLNMFDTVTLAREQVVDYIHGGLLVYDNRGNLIYHNELADKINIVSALDDIEDEQYFYEGRVYSVENREIVRDNIVYGNTVFIQDITERYNYEKNLEREKKRADDASDAKSEFLFSMSHDIRTPMNAILGMTKIAKLHMDEKEKVADCLKKIEMSGQHLLELINAILDMNKIEAGKLELQIEPFDMGEMLEEIITIATPLTQSMEHEFIIETDEIVHKAVCGDKSRIAQILTNIIGNAVKYTEKGGKIRLEATEDKEIIKREDGQEYANYCFVIQDNGMGMSEDYLPYIFDPFTRAKGDKIKKIQGSGLGMAITKQFVELMDGTISVESKLGEGSKFTVNLSLRVQTEEESSQMAKKVTLDDFMALDLSNKRVLLVEDFEINAEIAGEILSMVGIPVDYAVNGKEAVKRIEDCEDGYYDLVFMDIMMPVMNGYEATREIRAMDRKYAQTVPIVAMTANAFEEDIRNARDAGMNGHIAKPLDLNQLMVAIKKWLCV